MNPPANGRTPDAAAAPDRGKATIARVLAVLSLLCCCAFAVTLVYAGLGRAGCWGGAYLMIASAILLCAPGLVLFVVSACLRPKEILWLAAALVMLAFATGVVLQVIPPVTCSGSG